MQFLPEEYPAIDLSSGKDGTPVDAETGFALDVPMGVQAVPMWWDEHPDVMERILFLRQAYQIKVPDDMLGGEPTAVSVATTDTKPVKRRTKNKRFKQNPVLAKRKKDAALSVRSAGERASFLEWQSWELKGVPGVLPAQLKKYWLGEGLSRWATTATPFRSLVAALRTEGVPGRFINGLAAKLYHWHFGTWPGGKGKKEWDDVIELQRKYLDAIQETK